MFKFLTILKVGLKRSRANKMRSILTALGIIIGGLRDSDDRSRQGSRPRPVSDINALGSNS